MRSPPPQLALAGVCDSYGFLHAARALARFVFSRNVASSRKHCHSNTVSALGMRPYLRQRPCQRISATVSAESLVTTVNQSVFRPGGRSMRQTTKPVPRRHTPGVADSWDLLLHTELRTWTAIVLGQVV